MADERVVQAMKIVDPTTTSQQAAVDSGGFLQVDIGASSVTVNVDIAAQALNPIDIAGGTAGDVPIANDPVTIGGRASDAVPTPVSADGDVVDAWLSREGAVRVTLTDETGDLLVFTGGTALPIDIATATATVTITGTVTADAGTGDFLTVIGHTANEVFKEAGAFGGMMDDASVVVATEGNVSPVRITAQKAMHTTLRGTGANPLDLDAGTSGVDTLRVTVSTDDTVAVSGTVTANAGTGDFLSIAAHTANELFKEANAIGGMMDDTGPVVATEGNVSPVRITPNKAMHVQLRGTGANPLETNTGVRTADSLRVTVATDDVVPSSQSGLWKLDDPNSGIDIGDVDVTSVVPLTGATNLGKAESGAHTSGDVGVLALAVRDDTPVGLAADGQYIPLTTDSLGRLHVTDPNAGAGSPSTPARDEAGSSAVTLAAGVESTTEFRTVDFGADTFRLAGVDVSASVPFKASINIVDNDVKTRITTLFGRSGEPLQYRPPQRDYNEKIWAGTAGFDGFEVLVQNMDTSESADFYVTMYYED